MSRRGFLGVAAAGLAGVMLAPGIRLIEIAQAAPAAATPTAGASPKVRWGMLIDTTKCASGCTDCVTACNTENGLDPLADPVGAAAEDDGLAGAGGLALALRLLAERAGLVGGVHVGRGGPELAGAAVDALEDWPDGQLLAKGADLGFRGVG